MSRERGLIVTMSAARNEHSLPKKAHALWTLEWGRKHDGSNPMNIRSFDTLTRQRHGLWEGVST